MGIDVTSAMFRPILIFGFLGAAIVGMTSVDFASTLAPKILASYIALIAISLLLAAIACRLFHCRLATALTFVWGTALAWFVGLGATLSGALLAMAALALSSKIEKKTDRPVGLLVICGLLAIGGIAGWMLTWPIHYGWAWAIVLMGLCIWGRSELVATARVTRESWSVAVEAAPAFAAAAVLMTGIATVACWLPNMQADDLAYHLRLPAQLLQGHVYQPDPARMVWAYAPWIGDVLQSIPSLVAGEDARGAQNAVWIALIAGMAWTLAGNLKATRSMQWLCVMLVSSLPMLGGLAAGMHTELPATAVLLALFSLIHSELRGRLLFVAILAAGLAGLKLMHIVSAIPILGYLLWLNRGDLRPTNWVPAILVFAVLGLSSYVQSWLDTGNPVLPLFNGYFRSAVAPAVNFDDPRWHAGMSLTLPWDLTFNTTRYLEGGRGALGIVLVALAGSWAVAILRRQFAMPLLLATLALLLPLIVIQYARYALPGLVCMVVIIAVASETIIGKRWASILVVTTSLLNFLVYPSGNWILSTSAITRYVQSNGDESALYIRFLPAMEVLEAIPKNDQGIVLAADPGIPYVARFGKRGRTVSWYDTELNSASRAADMDSSGAAWLAILNNIQPTWLLTNRKHASSGLAVAIIKYGAIKAARCGDAELWRRSEIRNVDSHALAGKEPPDCRATAQ